MCRLPRLSHAVLMFGVCWAFTGQSQAGLSLRSNGASAGRQGWLQAFKIDRDRLSDRSGSLAVGGSADFGFNFDHSRGSMRLGFVGSGASQATSDAPRDRVVQPSSPSHESTQSLLLTLSVTDGGQSWDAGDIFSDEDLRDYSPHTSRISRDDLSTSGGVVGVSQVPVPPAVLLGALGFGCVVLMRRRLSSGAC